MMTLTGEMEKKLFRLADLRVQTAQMRRTETQVKEMAQLVEELLEYAQIEMLDQIENAVADYEREEV